MSRFLSFVVLATAGCQDISGFDGLPSMNPGQDCMACHSVNGQASGLQWNAAGTIYPTPYSASGDGLPNAEIQIIDSATPPRAMTLRSNGAGNFYTAEPLTPPLHVAVQYGGQRYQMQEGAPVGSCNMCHTLIPGTDTAAPLPPPYLDAGFYYGIPPTGRLFVPVMVPDGGGA